MHVVSIELFYRIASKQCHRPLNFGAQQAERALNTGLTPGCECKQVAAANTACICTHCERFDNVTTATNSTVADDFKPIMQCIGNGRYAINWSRCRIELPATVIGNHDRCGTRIRRFATVAHCLHTFNH